jgi:hypothetical protein
VEEQPGHRATLLARGLTHVGYGALRRGDEVIAAGAYSEVAARLEQPAPGRCGRRRGHRPVPEPGLTRIRQFSISGPAKRPWR